MNNGNIRTTGMLNASSIFTPGNIQCNNIACAGILNTPTISTGVNVANSTTGTSDIILSTSTAASSRSIRLETRSSYSQTGINSVQIGPAGSPSLSIGDTFC